MNKVFRVMLAGLLSLGLVGTALAEERGSKEEAIAMVEAALGHVKKVGSEQAFKDFTEDKASWSKKDLYVMAYSHDGTCVGHGANAKLVGKNLINMKDASGKEIIKEFSKLSTTKGAGWVEYEWAHPQTKKSEDKATYAKRIPGFDGWLGVGVYR